MANSAKTSKPAAKSAGKALKANPLKAFKRSETSKLVDLGTFKSFVDERFPVGTTWDLHRKSFIRKDKSCAIELVDPDGITKYYLNCSKPVSQLLRNNEITIAELAGLPVWQGEDWTNPKTGEVNPSVYLGMPAIDETDNTPRFNMREIEAEVFEVTSSWRPENFRTLD